MAYYATTGTTVSGNTNVIIDSNSTLSALQLTATNGILLNNATIATSFTIPSGYNAASVGPITINSGIAVTISAGQRWIIS